MDDAGLTRRAFAAYFRSGGTDQPANTSGVVNCDGVWYVVLHNVRGTLAVYRVKNDGGLRRMKKWPKELDEAV
jgi:hypothetical protein